MATDVNTGDLDVGENALLEVRQHDIVNDALEDSSFDFVHARLLLDPLRERDRVLQSSCEPCDPVAGW